MDNSVPLSLVVLAIAGILRWWMDRLDRARIREHLSKLGGRVLEISWSPFGAGWPATKGARIYDVRYMTQRGAQVKAKCATSIFSDVHWVRNTPPGFIEREKGVMAGSNISADEMENFSKEPAEPIKCLGCGSEIPASKALCSDCGWSYMQRDHNP